MEGLHEEAVMTGVKVRHQEKPTLPDLITSTEDELPVVETAPGTRGIRVEERMAEDMFELLADLPGIDPAKDVEISVAEGALTLRIECEEIPAKGRRAGLRCHTVVSAALPPGAKDGEAAAEYENSVLTIMVPVRETKPEPSQAVHRWSKAA
jgi:HSP20 family molecular chaperone IbpA